MVQTFEFILDLHPLKYILVFIIQIQISNIHVTSTPDPKLWRKQIKFRLHDSKLDSSFEKYRNISYKKTFERHYRWFFEFKKIKTTKTPYKHPSAQKIDFKQN